MCTLIIFDECDGCLQFYKLQGDYRHLNDVYINDDEGREALHIELTNLIYHPETGKKLHKSLTLGEFQNAARDLNNQMIMAGFLP